MASNSEKVPGDFPEDSVIVEAAQDEERGDYREMIKKFVENPKSNSLTPKEMALWCQKWPEKFVSWFIKWDEDWRTRNRRLVTRCRTVTDLNNELVQQSKDYEAQYEKLQHVKEKYDRKTDELRLETDKVKKDRADAMQLRQAWTNAIKDLESKRTLTKRFKECEAELNTTREELDMARTLIAQLQSHHGQDTNGASAMSSANHVGSSQDVPTVQKDTSIDHIDMPPPPSPEPELDDTLPSATSAPHIEKGRMLSWNHPKFTGDAGQLKRFLNHAEHDFRLYSQYFLSDSQKVAYAVHGLDDGPDAWFQQFYDFDPDNFQDPDFAANRREELLQLKQIRCKDLSEYITKFETLCATVRWPEDAKPDVFFEGLNYQIRTPLVLNGVDRGNYSLLKSCAMCIQQELDRRTVDRNRTTRNRSRVSSTTSTDAAKAAPLSAAQSSHQRSISGDCFVRGKPGHRAAACPAKKKISSVEAELRALEEPNADTPDPDSPSKI
ncbi:hypothetical protein KEM55_006210 [Ascosphaera atra]|nr:hypothetical protein KEM55_006210 [Ascosphaera atra]